MWGNGDRPHLRRLCVSSMNPDLVYYHGVKMGTVPNSRLRRRPAYFSSIIISLQDCLLTLLKTLFIFISETEVINITGIYINLDYYTFLAGKHIHK